MPTPEYWARFALDRYRVASEEAASIDEWTIEMMSRTQNGTVWHGRHPDEADFAVKIISSLPTLAGSSGDDR